MHHVCGAGTIIDLSQAEHCAHSRRRDYGEIRAQDMYSFGNLLYLACYGRIAHSIGWHDNSCTSKRTRHRSALVRSMFAELRATHDGRIHSST